MRSATAPRRWQRLRGITVSRFAHAFATSEGDVVGISLDDDAARISYVNAEEGEDFVISLADIRQLITALNAVMGDTTEDPDEPMTDTRPCKSGQWDREGIR